MILLSKQMDIPYGDYALYAGCTMASIALIWLYLEWRRYKDYWENF